jgi:hypothetical protein
MSEIVCFPVLNFTYSHVENSLFFALDGSFFVTRKTTYGMPFFVGYFLEKTLQTLHIPAFVYSCTTPRFY